MVLTKKKYRDWREIQDEYEEYMASLGPWSPEDVIEYLAEEYPDISSPEQQVKGFLMSAVESYEIN